MTRIHTIINGILEKHGELQVNLSSSSARKIITKEICDAILGRGKMLLVDEIAELKESISELEKDQIPDQWPPSDVY